ncbi:M24 family metallopeptidase [Bacillus sp. FJAT-49711]|uniref:M24 family metallopeptidase n=1 Tax=Bacillus sp. FJAT-49711 TaxID=2833585 RepID=UPI001BCA18EB|nr:M24 family metallopeptidase [Bacillus sp. FJAT-49711]MBS4219005.1 M24 family metallopeptidase [Bacillus sp. FJAT-49711]
MNIQLREAKLPEFGIAEEIPAVSKEEFERRCLAVYRAAKCDWFVVYGDREHFANMHYLSGYDPRFEEALLILGPNNAKFLLVGMEGLDYSVDKKIEADVILYQSFGLLGQDRTRSPRLDEILAGIGIKRVDRVGLCGWKYFESIEKVSDEPHFFIPAGIVECFKNVVDTPLMDKTRVLLHPTEGLRSYNNVDQIALYEWGASRASAAVHNIVRGVEVGMSEFEAVSNMQYAGEPLTAHIMFSARKEQMVGLRSPSGRKIELGDGVTTAVGYWGGLSCRAGVIDTENDEFVEKFAKPYFKAIVAWYETAGIGIKGGDLFEKCRSVLALGGLRPALNPGHLTSTDEWLHTPVRPESNEVIASGMALQCDVIPTPLPNGVGLNCEDSVVFADEALRKELKTKHPTVWERIQARRKFIIEEIGINIKDELLPLSSNPAYYNPLWLAPEKVMVVR